MTQAEKKENFLNSYRDSYGNLTEALRSSDTKASEYNKFIEMPDFKREVEAVQQLQDDLINSKFLSLVDAGDVRAVIKAKELLAERKDGVNIDELKHKIMIYLITHATTKTEALSNYCEWFRVTESAADSLYKKIIVENQLKDKTPIARAKNERKKIESSLAVRFKCNKLTEVEMLQGLLEQALYTSETAEYPSERSTASKEAREIGKRLEEIQEREARKNQISLSTLFERIDSAVFDAPVEKIREFEAQYNMIEAK